MPFIKVYNNDSDPYGLKGHSIFKSVRPFIFGYAVIPKLHEWCLRRHVRAASAEAVSFCRTFGDEAWSQQPPSTQSCKGLMGAIKVKAQSTQGTRSRLARAQPRAKVADPGGFTSRPRAPSSNGHTFGSPEAQSSQRSNLGQIATPTDRIAGAFNARIA
jgi:hypothetical protein